MLFLEKFLNLFGARISENASDCDQNQQLDKIPLVNAQATIGLTAGSHSKVQH